MSAPNLNADRMTMVEAPAAAALPLATQRLFARIVDSSRRSLASRVAMFLGHAALPGRSEFAVLRPATRLLIFGLATWIGIIAFVTVIAVASVEIAASSFPAWLGTRASGSAPTEIHPPASFEDILQRPLFSRSRHAPVVDIPSSVPMSAPLAMLDRDITLRGVFINLPQAKAFLTSAQNPLGIWVQANEEIAGWRVVAVEPDQVLLEASNEKLVIPLTVAGAGK